MSFVSFILSLFGQLKNLTLTLSESSFCDRFLPSPDCKKPNFSHFWDLRLADTLIAARRSHRQILAIPLVLWCIKKISRQLYKGHFVADLYYHLDEKSESAKKRFFADSSFSC